MKIKGMKVLLYAGFIGPLAYILHDISGSILSQNFSWIENSISDLTNSAAREANPVGVILLIISALAGMLFGAGILALSANAESRLLKLAGIILLVNGLLQLFTSTVFPQDPIGSPLTTPGLMHLILVAVSAVLAILLLITVARWAYHNPLYRFFGGITLTTLVILVAGGILTAIVVSKQLTVLGLVERLSIYPFQCWTVLFTYYLLNEYAGRHVRR